MNLLRAARRHLQSLFRRAPGPDTSRPTILGMVTTTGADELARRARLRRIHGTAPSWLDRPERDALRRDLRYSEDV